MPLQNAQVQSSVRMSDCVLASSSEFNDDGIVVSEETTGKDTWLSPEIRRLSQMSATSAMACVLLYLIAFVCTCLLSLAVRVHQSWFPSGPLTPLQLTAFSLCFTAIGLHLSNWYHVWLRCSHETALALRAASEMGAYLILMFVCDRTTLLSRRARRLDADFFTFVVLVFIGADIATARRIPSSPPSDSGAEVEAEQVGGGPLSLPAPTVSAAPRTPISLSVPPRFLNRYQVDEWVGWQVLLFMVYSYFQNVHLYRVIRVCVSVFVFLAGFTTYRKFDEESTGQHRELLLLRSVWRLNVLVIAVCAILRNQYMLYYIVVEQTFVMIAVYIMVKVGSLFCWRNHSFLIKICLVLILTCLLWDTPFSPSLFRYVSAPLQWIVRYDNSIVKVDPLYEWQYRTYLDHWIWLFGVVLGCRAKWVDGVLHKLDINGWTGTVVKCVVAGSTLIVLAAYWIRAFDYDAVTHNKYLPYVSWVPILAFVVLRNVFQRYRAYYLPMSTFVGSFGMEAYVVHTHMFTATTGANGNLLYTFHLLPGDFPLCDFGLLMGAALWASHRLQLTVAPLEQFFLPRQASPLAIAVNLTLLAFVVACTFGLHYWSWASN